MCVKLGLAAGAVRFERFSRIAARQDLKRHPDIAVLRDGTPQASRAEVYRRERQPEDTLGASAADEERLPSLRTRPDPILARLPGETFGID